ncbi:MAG TPA: DUF3060 domain-containing protein [Mycobacterium sp.]|nr:DUF3060 domain-containing protein [Mycobacterium sp.]
MNPQDNPEDRIRELERPLADSARASEVGSSQAAGQAYPPGPGVPPPPSPWTYGDTYGGTYGGPFSGPPPKPPSGNRMWWILGAVIVIGVIALAGGIAAFAAHQLSGVRSIITSPPTISVPFTSPANTPNSPAPSTSRTRASGPSTSPTPPPGGELSVSGINENRTIACNSSIVSVSGVSNTVVITGHCTSLTVSGVQNSITVDAVDTIDASGFNNKVTYHTGTPKITNAGDSNVVEQG